MKKIISLVSTLFVGSVLYAQILDTVLVRNLALRAEHWGYVVGKAGIGPTTDSLTINAVFRIRKKLLATPNLQLSTVVTVDSLAGRIVYGIYQIVKTAPGGEVAPYYTEITGAIEGKANLSFWVNQLNNAQTSDRTRFFDIGKWWLIDNNW